MNQNQEGSYLSTHMPIRRARGLESVFSMTQIDLDTLPVCFSRSEEILRNAPENHDERFSMAKQKTLGKQLIALTSCLQKPG